jgi:amino acid transporter
VTDLRRALGLPSLVFYAVGMILGAGVYSVIGAAAGEAGEALWVSFAIGAALAMATGLSYAELAAMYPRAGAEYVYVREALPGVRWLPVVVGIVFVMSVVSTATTVSIAFAGYLATWIDLPAMAVAAVLLAGLTGLNLLGIRETAWLNVIFTLVEVAGLVVVIAVAMAAPGFLEPLAAPVPFAVVPAAALVFFAYLGFEQIANLAEEAREPERNIPRALVISVVVTSVLYVLVAIAVVTLVSPGELAASESPLATALSARAPAAARALAAIALFATANTGLISLVAVSRMVYGMARDGDLPPVFRTVLARRRTPWVASLAIGAIAIALVPLGGVAAVASLSSFGALLAFFAVNVAVIVLRRRKPRARRPFRVPLSVRGVPLLPVLGAAASLVLAIQLDATAYLGGAVAIAVAFALYAARRLWS